MYIYCSVISLHLTKEAVFLGPALAAPLLAKHGGLDHHHKVASSYGLASNFALLPFLSWTEQLVNEWGIIWRWR